MFSSLEKCYWKAGWKEKVSVYTKELKREIGILEITQCNGKILETRLDFVLTLGLVFFYVAYSKISDKQIFILSIFLRTKYLCVCVPVFINIKIS